MATNEHHPLIPNYSAPEFKGLKKRRGQEKRFRLYGAVAILFSISFLSVLLFTIIGNGSSAFFQTEIQVPIHFDGEQFASSEAMENVSFRRLSATSFLSQFPQVTSRSDRRALNSLLTKRADKEIENFILENPEAVGKTVPVWITASSNVDMAYKHGGIKDNTAASGRLNEKQVQWLRQLDSQQLMRTSWNPYFFTEATSREPELAGIKGAIVGSFFLIVVCLAVSFPIGVAAAIYLKEFAPKNKITDLIELNINNLAAVPSIVYGLLALEVFLNVLGMQRSSPLVGGLTLSMLALPIIVITTQNALAAVPPSIKEAAVGLGASKVQVIFHHLLPAAVPGIMTGTILAVARAVGETAPLMMIGMVAFVADIPEKLTHPATALPVQIYLWSDSPEPGFQEKTAAAIMVLLAFLVVANATAAYIRKKSELKW